MLKKYRNRLFSALFNILTRDNVNVLSILKRFTSGLKLCTHGRTELKEKKRDISFKELFYNIS